MTSALLAHRVVENKMVFDKVNYWDNDDAQRDLLDTSRQMPNMHWKYADVEK